jgi:hypothetical protein
MVSNRCRRTAMNTRLHSGHILTRSRSIRVTRSATWRTVLVLTNRVTGVAKHKEPGGYTWHGNRHTFVSRLVMAGVGLRAV